MRILHIEDDPQDAELIRILLTAAWPGCDVECVADRAAFAAALQRRAFDVILSDCSLPGFDGFEALRMAKSSAPDAPFIFVSGTIGEDRALEAVRLGAEDYVLKDRMKRLVTAISRASCDAAERARRRRAEEQIRELADCLNQANDAVMMTDLDGRITYWNKGAERISGWAAEEALDRKVDDLFDESTAAQLAQACREASDRGEWRGELALRNRGGARLTVELRITVVRDDSGRPKSRVALATDVTARREAERQAREQAEMLNQAREAILITDLTGRVIYWNAGAEAMLGWAGSAVLGRKVDELAPAGALAPLRLGRADTLHTGGWRGELQLQNARGETLIVEARESLIRDDRGAAKALLCIATDVTDRKRLEEQFLRAQRMENLGLLAAGIAHDLNNTLAPILLAAPMLREAVSGDPALKLLDTLEKSAERGSLLVRQILSFAHGVGGEHQLLQVKHLLRDIAAVIAGTFPKSIRLEDYVPSDLWPIKGNPTQVHQVLLNLCVNARDAMPAGGTLQLRGENRLLTTADAAAIPGATAGAYLVLHVADTGTGIAPGILPRIWEPFFTTKDAGRGTGLGLSTVRGIVEAHHGFVEVASRVGEGTRFSVFLPAADVSFTDPLAHAARSLPRGNGELIMVVDDEPQIREITSAVLGQFGYRVVVASDGVEAAALFAQRASEVRLVISDLHMPNLDGAMLAGALRRMNSQARMLVMSGMATGLGDRGEFRPDEFADALLLKPFKPETLLDQVHALLHRAPGDKAGHGPA